MGVVDVEELWEEWEGSIDSRWQRTYTRSWRVQCDSRRDGPVTARSAAGIPALGTSYEVTSTEKDTGSYVQSITCRCESASANPDHAQWKVTASYGPYDATAWSQNPIEWPLKLSWSWAQYERIIWADVDGNPILNSAGDPFSDPVTIDDSRPVLRVTRNEATFDPALVDLYRDKVNSGAFCGAPAGYVKMAAPTAELAFNPDAGGFYYVVTYEFHFNRDGWKKSILDQGFAEKVSGKLKPIMNQGQKVDEPVPLNGSGARLPVGGTAVFLEFDVYEEADFSALGFDFAAAPGWGG